MLQQLLKKVIFLFNINALKNKFYYLFCLNLFDKILLFIDKNEMLLKILIDSTGYPRSIPIM